ncbi:hypothetical protein [Marinobacter sp. HL-58]|uniref:hypothetical protein n=1 Tax=Marinobacter sp. HL-58 TaxID=1479237 RepID=UPI00048997DB|nr:hypothetical protein [Marinobacter sp. HL-58]KPP99933.1 MAG: hypothetical protein HLUCCO03_16520 [Marinobacter sp. HL-58]
MEADTLFDLVGSDHFVLLIAVAALVVAVIAILSGTASRRKLSTQNDTVKQRVDSLWAEMDELRVSQFNSPGASAGNDATGSERFAAEKAAYEAIWPVVWSLHDKLGMFLRAVEADDQAGELRLEARNAALTARSTLNRVRPFCHGDIDQLITQLIDNHIKAHLAACHYMDLRKDSLSSSSNHDRAVQKEKFHMLYDGQAKEMLDQLVTLIRNRMLK